MLNGKQQLVNAGWRQKGREMKIINDKQAKVVYTNRSLLGNFKVEPVNKGFNGKSEQTRLKIYSTFEKFWKWFRRVWGEIKDALPAEVASETYRFCSKKIPACENSIPFYPEENFGDKNS